MASHVDTRHKRIALLETQRRAARSKHWQIRKERPPLMDYAVKKQIKHLCGYISDKSAVLQHVNREHNLRLTLNDLEAVIKRKNIRARRADLEAMTPSPLIVTHTRKGYDDLALALFKYHAARAFGPEQVYWLDRMNDRKPQPKTTLEI
jgi:hypothetical protein